MTDTAKPTQAAAPATAEQAAPRTLAMATFERRVETEVTGLLAAAEQVVGDTERLGRGTMARSLFDSYRSIVVRRIANTRKMLVRFETLSRSRIVVVTEIERARDARRSHRFARGREKFALAVEANLERLCVIERKRVETLQDAWTEAEEAVIAARLLRENLHRMCDEAASYGSLPDAREEPTPFSTAFSQTKTGRVA
ncbi:MAG: hypothetical protein ACYDHY_15360 [Acidiferrobacterales bacterium]